MSRQYDFEIADIADPKPKRGSNLGNIEADLPTYEEAYEKLDINTTMPSNPRSNLPVEVTNDPMKTLKHWLRDSDYADFAQCTNVNASASNARAVSKSTTKRKGRPWKETNGAEMKVFIGILFYIGVHPIGSTTCAEYWSRSPKTPYHPVVYNAMSSNRFHQITRYFKASNAYDESSMDMQGDDWWKKVDPLCTNFRIRSQEAIQPGRDVALDELLIECHGRSKHTLQIPSKAAGKGYKAYAACFIGYLYNFVFTSRTEKIAEVPKATNVRQTSTMIKQLMQTLPNEGKGHVVYLDNFFSTVELYSDLKSLGIGACGTCKAGSGIPRPLSDLRGALTMQNWGYRRTQRTKPEVTVYQKGPNGKKKVTKQTKPGSQEVNCAIWQDMKPVQFMTTVHDDEDFESYREKNRVRRKKFANHDKELENAPLRIPNPIDEYNQRMGYVDQHAQLQSYYSVQQSHFRVWWPLFFFLLDAILVNVWVLLRITGSTLLHRDMQVDLAYELIKEGLQELANDPLKYPRTQRYRPGDLPEGTTHNLVKKSRRHCVICREEGRRKRKRGRKRLKRKVLGERSTNQEAPTHADDRGSQTSFECSACQVPLCKKGECWTKYHRELYVEVSG
jgi:hypothetical protein